MEQKIFDAIRSGDLRRVALTLDELERRLVKLETVKVNKAGNREKHRSLRTEIQEVKMRTDALAEQLGFKFEAPTQVTKLAKLEDEAQVIDVTPVKATED